MTEQTVWVFVYQDKIHSECDVYLSEEAFEKGVLDMVRVDENLPIPPGERQTLLSMHDAHLIGEDPSDWFNEFWEHLTDLLSDANVQINYYVRVAR